MRTEQFQGVPQEALTVRITVFVEEQGFADEIDEIDGIATHFVLFSDEQKPIATCRVFATDGKGEYILGRLCVLKEHRGKGYGSSLIEQAERYVTALGGNRLRLHSQYHAASFYEKLGYVAYGEVENEQGKPHIWMVKHITGMV